MNESNRKSWLAYSLLLLPPIVLLLIPYAQRMWRAGHYQFFPIVLGAVALMLWQRRFAIAAARTPANGTLVVAGTALYFMFAFAANLLISGLGAILGLVFALGLTIYGAFGWGGLRVASPVLLLLVFIVPLPMNYDQALIFEMQFVASQLSSWLLDGIGLIHFRNGVVLMTEKSQYLTEEACSGIRSLFSTLAIVSIVGILARLIWWRTLINLVQAVFWVIVGNAIRVALVVHIADNHTDWVAKGTGHEIVGMVLFVFILWMVYSTDAGIMMLINRIRGRFVDLDDSEDSVVIQPVPIEANPVPGGGTLGMASMVLCSLLLGAISLRVAYVRFDDRPQLSLASMPRLQPPDETDLPQALQGWTLDSFGHLHRETSFFQAEDSYVWKYRKGPLVAQVSLDGPWAEWHDLSFCYRGLGWTTEPEYFLEVQGKYGLADTAELRHSEVRMQRGEDYGFVIFSSVDRDGKELLPDWRSIAGRPASLPVAVLRAAAGALGFSAQTQSDLVGNELPATTIQTLVVAEEALTEDDLEESRALFLQAREILIKSRRFHGGTPE